MAENYQDPVDYRLQPLTVGTQVAYISDIDGTLTTGTIAYLSDDHACIDSGGLLTVRKAWTHRTANKPTFVKYRTIARITPAPTTPTETGGGHADQH